MIAVDAILDAVSTRNYQQNISVQVPDPPGLAAEEHFALRPMYLSKTPQL